MSDDQNIDIAVGVNNEDLAKGFDETASQIDNVTETIGDSFSNVSRQISSSMENAILTMNNNIQQMRDAFGDAAKAIKSNMEDAAEKVDKEAKKVGRIAGMFNKFGDWAKDSSKPWTNFTDSIKGAGKALLPVVGAIGAAGKAMQSCLSASTQWNAEVIKLARSLGTTTEQASVLNRALGSINSSTDEYMRATQALTQRLSAGSDAFEKLGIKTKDANGKLKPTTDIMQDAIKKLNSIEQGTARNAAGVMLFGRSWGEMGNLMKLNNQVMDEARECANKLNLIVGGDAVEAQEKWNKTMNDAKFTVKALGIGIGKELMTSVSDLTSGFNACGDSAKVLINIFKAVMTVVDVVVFLVRALTNVITGFVMLIANNVSTMVSTLIKVIKGDIKGAWAEMKGGAQNARIEMGAAFDEIGSNYEKMTESMSKRWSGAGDGATTVGSQGSEPGPDIDDNKNKRDSRMSLWQDLLKIEQDNKAKEFELHGKYNEMSLWQEKEFWQKKQALSDLSADERRSIEVKIADVDRAIRKENFDGFIADLHAQQAAAMSDLDKKKELIQKEIDAYKDGTKQKSQALQKLADVEREIADRRLRMEEQTAAWRQLSDSIKASMENCFIGLANGTMSWSNATKNMLNTVLQHFIQMAAKEFASFVSYENLKTLFKKKAVTEQTAAKIAGGATEQAIDIQTATTGVTASGVEAGAGVFASIAKIPIIGPFLAPAAAAAAIAAVMAMLGQLSSAAGGWGEIPADQLAMVHKQEMILPAKFANPFRQMLEGGGWNAINATMASMAVMVSRMSVPFEKMAANDSRVSQNMQRRRDNTGDTFDGGGFGEGGGNAQPIVVNISAVDSQDVKRLFKNHGPAMVTAIKSQARNFAFNG